jgi:hypothetical protein
MKNRFYQALYLKVFMQTKDHVDKPWDKTENVDPAEVDRFEALADEWWGPSGKLYF